MTFRRGGLMGVAIAIALAVPAMAQSDSRAAYSYVREVSGDVTVNSRWNGSVQASRNMPISVGDEIQVSEAGRAEIGLADGNILYVGGGSQARIQSLRDQQGEDQEASIVRLEDGSLVLAAVGSNEHAVPRIDTEDATVYLKPGARARVNYDPNRGTVVVSRAGTADVRTREGSYRVRAGEYLTVRGDEEPEIERGAFSRDRFDLWAADRYESAFETRSASATYVDDESSGDVSSMDGYGDWSYNDTYGSYVWKPQVAAGWSPYSNGSWYYTPAGLTWWSYDPWGWYPFHYGNWFFDASWGSWCWAPGFVYSPAWVFWAYTPSFVGWCPVGWYSYYSPWSSTYYRNWGWTGRGGVYLSVHGVFPTRTVDFRGWNFAGAGGVGAAHMDVIAGARMAGRLGQTVAVSSRPVVVPARPGEGREAIQSFVRDAPRTVERTSTGDPGRLSPMLARERTLPASTVEEMRNRAVVVDRGRLTGPGVADIAPRGAPVDRTRSLDFRSSPASPAVRPATDRARDFSTTSASNQGIARSVPNRVESRTVVRGDQNGVETKSSAAAARDDWRQRSRSLDSQAMQQPPQAATSDRAADDWRSRSSVPPARRVIEGAVPGRRGYDSDRQLYRQTDPRDLRGGGAPAYRPDQAPRPAPRRDAPSSSHSAPAPHSAPHSTSHSSSPPHH